MVDSPVRCVYCTNFWNVPVAGHAWYKNEYVYFQLSGMDPDSEYFDLHRFNDEELIHALAERKAWEDLVGYHFSYAENKCIGDLIFSPTGIDPNLFENNRSFFKEFIPTPENVIEINIPIEFLKLG